MRFLGGLAVLIVVLSTAMATMNVGTFWFAQNNGKFYPVKPYPMSRGGNAALQYENSDYEDPSTELRIGGPKWWTDYKMWNKMLKFA